jgi:hypothetical protein
MRLHHPGVSTTGAVTMFTKTIITLSAAATLATALASAVNAQSNRWPDQPRQKVLPFTEAERLLFSIPEGRDHYVR